MDFDLNSVRQKAIHELKEWIRQQQFAGVSGSGEDGTGIRIYVGSKITREVEDAIKERAGKIRLTFVELDGPIKQY